MSRSLAMNSGSRDSLKVLTRCGTSPCAFQIPCTAPRLMPTALAMARPVQWVASPGGASRVNSTTRSTVASDRRGVPGGRVLSRRRPATPSAINRSCQRQTHGLDLPVRCRIVLVPRSSAVARTISARPTCFLRAAAIGHHRLQAGTVGGRNLDGDPFAHPTDLAPSRRMGTVCLGQSTSVQTLLLLIALISVVLMWPAAPCNPILVMRAAPDAKNLKDQCAEAFRV